MTTVKNNERIGKSTAAKPIPHIPLPFDEVMKDVLKVKPLEKVQRKPMADRKIPK